MSRVIDMSKTFGRQKALDGVTADFRSGAITALLGQNGSGKSTLIKVLAGVYEPDGQGSIQIGGAAVPMPLRPTAVRAFGLHFVHQDLGLVPELTVAENIGLTNCFGARAVGRIRWSAVHRRARARLMRFGLDVDPRRPVGELPAVEQTLVAIARAFAEAREDLPAEQKEQAVTALVLDEPTAALPREQTSILFDAIGKVRDEGVAVIYVTHRLEEVFELADDVVVLRDGKVVMRDAVPSCSKPELVEAIIGREAPALRRSTVAIASATEAVLECHALCGSRVGDIEISVAPGEILGVAGLRGSGRSELARLLAGAQRPASGSIMFDGEDITGAGSRQMIRKGIVYVPEDRRGQGGIGEMDMKANLTLPRLRDFWRVACLSRTAEADVVRDLIDRFQVVPPNPAAQFGKLSGGNQQKSILARRLRFEPRLLVLDEPTQGIDVGAKADILNLLRSRAGEGYSMVLVSSEFGELEAACHRVVVLQRGRAVGTLAGAECTAANITRACFDRGGSDGGRVGPA